MKFPVSFWTAAEAANCFVNSFVLVVLFSLTRSDYAELAAQDKR
jgi:hypothetical protein